MRFLIWILIYWGIASTAFAGQIYNVGESGVILGGYDPVSYFQSVKPLKGDAKFQTKQDGVVYYFSSEKNKQAFMKEPQKYVPQYGGWCAYAVAGKKSKVDIDPESFLIQDGRLLVFYKGIWGDTRDKWLHTAGKDEKAFLKEADANWPETKLKEP